MAIGAGVFMFFGIREIYKEQYQMEVDPLVIVNNFIIFWFLFDLMIRYFMQQMPVMNIKPLMIVPIKQKTIIHFLLGKTTISFFNFLPVFIFIPFCIVLLAHGYSPINVICWFISVMAI